MVMLFEVFSAEGIDMYHAIIKSFLYMCSKLIICFAQRGTFLKALILLRRIKIPFDG